MRLIEEYLLIIIVLTYWLILSFILLEALHEVPYFMWKLTLKLIEPQTSKITIWR